MLLLWEKFGHKAGLRDIDKRARPTVGTDSPRWEGAEREASTGNKPGNRPVRAVHYYRRCADATSLTASAWTKLRWLILLLAQHLIAKDDVSEVLLLTSRYQCGRINNISYLRAARLPYSFGGCGGAFNQSGREPTEAHR